MAEVRRPAPALEAVDHDVVAIEEIPDDRLARGAVGVQERDAPGVTLRVLPLTTRDPRPLLDEGVDADEATRPPLAPHAGWAIASGLLEPAKGADGRLRLRLTTRGRLLSNELVLRLV